MFCTCDTTNDNCCAEFWLEVAVSTGCVCWSKKKRSELANPSADVPQKSIQKLETGKRSEQKVDISKVSKFIIA